MAELRCPLLPASAATVTQHDRAKRNEAVISVGVASGSNVNIDNPSSYTLVRKCDCEARAKRFPFYTSMTMFTVNCVCCFAVVFAIESILIPEAINFLDIDATSQYFMMVVCPLSTAVFGLEICVLRFVLLKVLRSSTNAYPRECDECNGPEKCLNQAWFEGNVLGSFIYTLVICVRAHVVTYSVSDVMTMLREIGFIYTLTALIVFSIFGRNKNPKKFEKMVCDHV